MFTESEVKRFREETPGTAFNIHLNNAGAALMPQVVIDAMIQHIKLEAKLGGYEAAEARKIEINDFYRVVSELLNASSDNIAYATSATDAYSRALSSIPFSEGDVILTTTDDYVSNQLAFLQLKQQFGVQLVRAENTLQGTVDCQSIQDLLEKHRPKLLAVTHVPTNSGLVQPIEEIGEICRAFECLYMVDACQSAGQLKVDVEQIQCDFLSATFRKFLRGPRGSGFLYVSSRVLEKEYAPNFIDLRSSRWTAADRFKLVENAKRFELWEQSYSNLLGSWSATKYLLEVGIDKVEQRIQFLSRKLRDHLKTLNGVQVLDRGLRLCGIVTFTVEGVEPTSFAKKLNESGINASLVYEESARIDMHQKGVDWACRFSPHYYTTDEEIDQTIQIVKNLVA